MLFNSHTCMSQRSCGVVALLLSMACPIQAFAEHDRAKKEAKLREKFEWVVFDGEYHLYQLGVVGLDVAFGSGGELSKEYVQAKAQKLGIDFAARLAQEPKKSPIAAGLLEFKIWEEIAGQKIQLGYKYVPYMGVLKNKDDSPVPVRPDPHGYHEFRRRMDEAYLGRTDLPELGKSVEAKWIKYIIGHCAGNYGNRKGYKEFRRRLDVAYQYRYHRADFEKNYRGTPNLDLETIPPAFPPGSAVGAMLKEFIAHCVGNPDGETGYVEFHRRIAEEILPKAQELLSTDPTPESVWTLYIMSHLAGNFAVIEM